MKPPTHIFNATALRKRRARHPYIKPSAEEDRQVSDRRFYGSLGPASPVRKIDPKTGLVVEIIKSRP
jgi:hypothetical protein